MKLAEIDQSKLKYPLLKKLLKDQMNNGVVKFTDLVSTVPPKTQLSSYGYVEDCYQINHPIEVVFEKYKAANPKEAWKGGGLVDFALGLDKNNGEIYYPGDDYPGAKVGQVLYFHSSILGLKKLCMAQEIVQVDKTNNVIEFSYVEGGMTAGSQIIRFKSISPNETQITHTSHFKGVSPARDKYLYPYFHSKIISKFHTNLKKALG
tara:strand:+ start:30097 stop:30714 length:618 start_codon:yes stop_codon:yes gene_type:complete